MQTSSPSEYEAERENQEALKAAVNEALGGDIAPTVSSVSASCYEGKYKVTVRSVAVGGAYFPKIIDAGAPVFFEKLEELGLESGEFEVVEYSDSNTGGTSNMIRWGTEDGTTGLYVDGREDTPVIKHMTVDELREQFG